MQRSLGLHLKRFDAMIAEGAPGLGWKVAFNVRSIQEQLGLTGSLVAGLTRKSLCEPGAPHSLGGAVAPALEAEVFVSLGEDVRPEDSESQIAASISEWGAAVEIVDFNRSFDELEAIVEEGVFHRALVLGKSSQVVRGADLAEHRVRVDYGGHLLCDVDAREATGHAPTILRHLARLLLPHGHRLAAGDIVILGSMNPLTLARSGRTFAVSIDGIGAVSVALES